MTPFTLVAIAFVLALLLFGFAFWTPIYALPLAALFLIGLAAFQFARRKAPDAELRRFREQAQQGDAVDRAGFTDRDRETLYEGKRR